MVKCLGLVRVKNEAQFIAEVLDSMDFCEKILLFDDHSTDLTVAIAAEFPNVDVLESPFEERPHWVEEGRDRTFHAEFARAYNPEWCVQVNGDEILEYNTWTKVYPLLDSCFHVINIQSLNYWDNTETLRVDGHFSQSYRQTFWRYPKDGSLKYGFAHDSLPAALHGKTTAWDTGIALWHYGGISAERRKLRADLYKAIDPNFTCSDWRVMLQGDPGGPRKEENLTGEPFRLQSVTDYLASVNNRYSRRKWENRGRLA